MNTYIVYCVCLCSSSLRSRNCKYQEIFGKLISTDRTIALPVALHILYQPFLFIMSSLYHTYIDNTALHLRHFIVFYVPLPWCCHHLLMVYTVHVCGRRNKTYVERTFIFTVEYIPMYGFSRLYTATVYLYHSHQLVVSSREKRKYVSIQLILLK